MKRILEIACFNIESAIIAQAAGADRIELCEDYLSGGLTPSEKLILDSRKKINIPIHVIIRPRNGIFFYSNSEIEEMKKSILFCKHNKIEGVVFGVLTRENEIDKKICKDLIQLAHPMQATFHRAIDVCKNIDRAFRELIELKFQRALSSGGELCALDGLEKLKKLQMDYGNKIIIMPGGAIRSSIITKLIATNCQEFHSSAILSKELITNENEVKKLKYLLNQGINL